MVDRTTYTTTTGELRDAAVDPRPADHLPPTNAGKADPHGPEVVSPEIHASEGTRPVLPGPVGDANEQEVEETVHAAAETDVTLDRPSGNATRDEWAAYAAAVGIDVDDTMGRNDIRDAVQDAED